MRSSTLYVFAGTFLVGFFLAALGPVGFSGHEALSSALPAQISEFYHDYNYICTFSTQSERKELAKFLDRNYLPDESKSERLAEIFKLMKKVKQRILFNDEYATAPGKASLWKNVFRPEYYRIRSFDVKGGRAAVGVSAYEIQPADVLRFISRYSDLKSQATDAPALDQMLSELEKIICRKESHEWVLHAGQWKKRDGHLVYIKR